MQEETLCRECGQEFDTSEQVRRHLRKHKMSYKDYVLKWKYDNIKPICKCGCGQETLWNIALKDFAVHVQGHHAWGCKKSDEEKQKIGRKNSENMKRYYAEHHDEAMRKVALMNAAHTPEVEAKRIKATRRAYETMSFEDKQKFSDNTKKLWRESRELMDAAREKAAITFKERAANGEYDLESRNRKISKAITQLYIDGGQAWGTGHYTSTKTGKTIYHRSSWELQYAQLLDEDPDVLTWEFEWEGIPYEIDGVIHHYVPDFHVVMNDKSHLFVEVKPQALVETDVNAAKRNAALRVCEHRGWKYVSWAPVV